METPDDDGDGSGVLEVTYRQSLSAKPVFWCLFGRQEKLGVLVIIDEETQRHGGVAVRLCLA